MRIIKEEKDYATGRYQIVLETPEELAWSNTQIASACDNHGDPNQHRHFGQHVEKFPLLGKKWEQHVKVIVDTD